MADGSVQQTDANQQNGYAKLDGSGHVTVPVTGSVAEAAANDAGDTVSSIADTAKSAASTASNAQTIASGALQKSEIGQKNSAAPTDANAMMSAAVSGDSSASPAMSKYATFGGAPGASRTMADRFGDTWNLRDFGMKMDASDADAALLNSLVVPTNTVYTYSNGSLPDESKLTAKGGGLVQLTGPNSTVAPNIDGWIFEGLGDGKTVVRVIDKNIPWASTETIHTRFAYTGNAGTPNLYNTSITTDSSIDANGNVVKPSGGIVNLNAAMNSYGTRDANGFDVNGQFINTRHGTDWNWASIFVIHEPTAKAISQSNTQEWIQENDYGAWGSEGPYATRHGSMFTGWQEGGGFGNGWQSNHQYNVGDAIEVNVNGIATSAIVTVAGTSASTTPTWANLSMSESDFTNGTTPTTLTDGTVTWAYNGILRAHISSAYSVSYQPDSYSGYQDSDIPTNKYGSTSRTPFVYGSALIADGVFDGAVLDFRDVQFLKNNNPHVWARIPQDTYIDLSAQYNSSSGYNVRLFGYDSSTGTLTYKINGSPVWALNNSGMQTAEVTYGVGGHYSDPAVGKTYDAKFGGAGIAATEVQTGNLIATLENLSRTDIENISGPKIGRIEYDVTDDAPAVYTATGWKLMSLTAMPSN
ncbi:hypothetical protein [Acetobacter phage phiAP1]|nr:hypothetical protein [Acetobacter phage phiAP1]